MSDLRLISGHRVEQKNRNVERYSSSWNMDYMDSEAYLRCECGWEKSLSSSLIGRDAEVRLAVLEHSVAMLGKVHNPEGVRFGD